MPAYQTHTRSNPNTNHEIPTVTRVRPTYPECVGKEDIIMGEVIEDLSDAIKIDNQCYSKTALRGWIRKCNKDRIIPTVPHSRRKLSNLEIFKISRKFRRGGKLKNIKKSRKSRKTYIKNKTKKTKYRNKK
jgi:hypothetical protein